MRSLLNNILLLPAAISAFVINSFFIAYIATKLGDPTSRLKGKLSLSPRVHIDLIGILLLITTGFGWTKSLDVNPRYFKNQKRDSILTVLSGSFANFIFAFITCIIFKILSLIPLSSFWEPLLFITESIFVFNILWGLFCLLPIPPLNGFLILEKLLPTRYFRILDFLQKYGIIVLIFLSILGVIKAITYPFYRIILNSMLCIVNFLFRLI